MENKVKQFLGEGLPVLGTWLSESRSPAVMVAVARSGLDFVIIDVEHSQYDLETIQDLCIVGREAGICSIVRIPELNRSLVGRVLDAGAMGFVLPRVKTVSEVQEAVSFARFPPRGVRGFNLGFANTRYRPTDLTSETLRAADDEVLVIIMIEEKAALDRVDDIVAVPGVDIAFIGPSDLSISLGVPGDYFGPVSREATRQVVEACRRHGVAPGISSLGPPFDADLAAGMRFIAFSDDVYMIHDACRQAMAGFARLAARPELPGAGLAQG
jgi:2-keto-3-deoxy-L-rhamnonate aldolase RhmA